MRISGIGRAAKLYTFIQGEKAISPDLEEIMRDILLRASGRLRPREPGFHCLSWGLESG